MLACSNADRQEQNVEDLKRFSVCLHMTSETLVGWVYHG